MERSSRRAFLLARFAVIASIGACGGSNDARIAVSVSPSTATLQPGGEVLFSAVVDNDDANGGVLWKLSCSATECGSVSPTGTANGIQTKYTAPATPLPSDVRVTLTAR